VSLTDLPAVNACLNGLSAIFLTTGYYFIRHGNRTAHRHCRVSAFVSSTIFLACYLTYHIGMRIHYGKGHTEFHDPQWFRPIYLFILFSHLTLAIAIVPLVLITLHRAVKQRFELHKKIARVTWPIWMYVSVTGVIIYVVLYHIFRQT